MSDPMRLLEQALRHARAYVESLSERPVRATADAAALRQVLAGPLPVEGHDASDVLDQLARAATDGTVATTGPRFFGFVVGGSLPVATAADCLTSVWDQNAGIYVLSPLAAVVEESVLEWIREIVGLPATFTGGFVTDGQMANFTGLCAARLSVLRNAGWDVEADGLSGAPQVEVFATEEAHYSIARSLRMLGLGSKALRPVPTDAQGRMQATELERMVAGASGPAVVCAQAGNVNTGAFDPLPDVVDVAKSRGAWLHVDGAFGLWAALSPTRAHMLSGIAQADSIATDAHKWLNVPYDCGIVLSAHPSVLRASMTLAAPYIVESDAERDPRQYVPEESRRARAIPTYAVMRSLGRTGLTSMIERACEVAEHVGRRFRREPGVSVLNDVVLNQVLVRFEGQGPEAGDELTRAVIDGTQKDGTCWVGGTTWKGRVAMRFSVSNASTTIADADRSVEAILAVHARSRSR